MFKEKYKECFNDIKGDRKLLKAILEKSENTKNKRIPFKGLYSYTATCAAVLVVTCAVFLYNNGYLKPQNNLTHTSSTQSENIVSYTTEKESSFNGNEASENQMSKKLEADSESNITTSENKSVNGAADLSQSAEHAQSKSASVTEYKVSEYLADSLAQENYVNEEVNGSVASGGGSSASPMMARMMPDTSVSFVEAETLPDIIAGKVVNKTYAGENILTVFREGINTVPEITVFENSLFCEKYTDNNTKSVTIYYSQSPINISDGENNHETSLKIFKANNLFKAYVKGGLYYFVSAENISEEYMLQIVESLINN